MASWLGLPLPKSYSDVTEQIDIKGLDLLNSDSNFGHARTLFDPSKPQSLDPTTTSNDKPPPSEDTPSKDWVESDTDEQLMLFIPFQSNLKIHTLHITSLPLSPSSENDSKSDSPMRPKTLHLYTNRAHILGFEEAEDLPSTQTIVLQTQDWDPQTGTAKLELRFVKFQNISSLVIFVQDGNGDDGGASERVRIDRIKIIGETGSKREMGKLEKVGDEAGE